LRFYHCLNSGMEVITTDIPQARHFKDAVHIVRAAEEIPVLFTDTGRLKLHKQPAYAPVTWQQRADRLVEIVQRLPRMQRLAKSTGMAVTRQ
jgi:tRNA-dihydrouridine synthase